MEHSRFERIRQNLQACDNLTKGKKSIEIEETMKLENASSSNQEKRMQFDECDEEEMSDFECEQEREMRGQVNNAWSNPVEI